MHRPPVWLQSAWLRIAIVVLVVAGTLTVAVLEGVGDPASIGGVIDDAGPVMPLAFIGVHVISSLLFVPRAIMAGVAGTLWGFAEACLWSLIGATAGATAGFLLARYLNGGLIVPETMKRVGPLLQRAEAGGWRTIMLIRLVPFLPHALTNYTLGLTRVRLVDFVVGSFFGLFPHTFVFINFGITGRRVLDGGAWLEPMLWGLAFLGLTLLLPRLVRRSP